MSSQLKSDTARANGAKSKGPKSAATREISSRNAIDHGITACNTLLLACENQEDFDKACAEHYAMYQPATMEEEGLVREMIAFFWRYQRFGVAETALVDMEMIRRQPEIEKEFVNCPPRFVLGAAIRSLSDNSRSMALISRYASRILRANERVRQVLAYLQDRRKREAAEAAAARAEPTSPTPPPATPPSGAPPPSRTPETPEIRNPTAKIRPVAAPRRCEQKMQQRTHRRSLDRGFGRPNRSLKDILRVWALHRKGILA